MKCLSIRFDGPVALTLLAHGLHNEFDLLCSTRKLLNVGSSPRLSSFLCIDVSYEAGTGFCRRYAEQKHPAGLGTLFIAIKPFLLQKIVFDLQLKCLANWYHNILSVPECSNCTTQLRIDGSFQSDDHTVSSYQKRSNVYLCIAPRSSLTKLAPHCIWNT